MEKKFSIEGQNSEVQPNYKDRILSIVNDIEKRVRLINPDQLLSKELHEARALDARKENAEFEMVRRDVRESFGVPDDAEHVYLYDNKIQGTVEQRALRAFFVMIDTVRRENFYGEGRIDHNTLFRNLVGLAKKFDATIDFDSVVERMDTDPPQYLIFKGFLSVKDFREISDSSRKVLETPLFDAEGEKIDTASDWFLTGHNLPEHTA